MLRGFQWKYDDRFTYLYGTPIVRVEMPNHTTDEPTAPLADSTLVEVATELRRLATDLLKDVRKSCALPGLSQIAAMRPLQNLLAEALAERAFSNPNQEAELQVQPKTEENWFGFGIRPRS